LNVAQGVGGDDAANGADAIGGVDHFFVRVENKIGRMDDFSPLLPKGAYFVRISGNFKSVSHGKSKLEFVHGLLGLVEWIHGKGDDLDVFFLELFDV
jgi:hypothetical protein